MNKIIIASLISMSHIGLGHSGIPLWTFSAPNPASIALADGEIGTVQYTVTNQSQRSKNLVLQNTQGLSATPCYLAGQGATCNLTLTINGSEVIVNHAQPGPILCEADAQGHPNANQCYQPSHAHVLNIRKNASLQTSINDLALSVGGLTEYGIAGGIPSGASRIITITNSSEFPTTGITITNSGLPSDTTYTTTCGTSLASQASCTITITPGLIANSDGSDPCTVGTKPIPGTIQVSADNAKTVTTNVTVLGYGCIYQEGYVFAFDDTTSLAGSVGGKALSPTEIATVNWSSNTDGLATIDIIPWISETSLSPTYTDAKDSYESSYTNYLDFPFPASTQFSICTGHTDGACNSANILALYRTYITSSQDGIVATGPTPPNVYAAGGCSTSFDNHADWYMPAICEMGYDGSGGNSGCGSSSAPTLQNMQSNLASLNLFSGVYWSSTESANTPRTQAWYQQFDQSDQFPVDKETPLRALCIRVLTI